MQAIERKLIDFHDAINANDGMKVQKMLNENMTSSTQLSVKMITGMLVIALEQGLSQASQAIIVYNSYATDKIENRHFDSIMRLAARNKTSTNIIPN